MMATFQFNELTMKKAKWRSGVFIFNFNAFSMWRLYRWFSTSNYQLGKLINDFAPILSTWFQYDGNNGRWCVKQNRSFPQNVRLNLSFY